MPRVLSLRGGGVRGIATALLLSELERSLGHPLAEVFDLVVGTSIGGILATAIALKIPCSDLVTFFEVEGPKIFKPRTFAPALAMLGHPRYQISNLVSALERHFMRETILAHTFTKLMVTSTRYAGLKSCLWKSWKQPDMSAVQAAASSAAAMTYFGPVFIDGFAQGDGGYFANNPAACAAVEARKLWPLEPIRLVDVACPDDKSQFTPTGGVLQAAPHIASIFIGAGEDAAGYLASKIIGGDGVMISIQPTLLTAKHSIGDASKENLEALKLCAMYEIDNNVQGIRATLGSPWNS